MLFIIICYNGKTGEFVFLEDTMKRVSTSALVPGMVTAEEVFNYKGALILPKGHTLTEESIEKLEFYSVINVRVEEEADQETEDTAGENGIRIEFDEKSNVQTPAAAQEDAEPEETEPEEGKPKEAEDRTESEKAPEPPKPKAAPSFPMEKDSYTERLRKTEEFQSFEKDFRQATASFMDSMNDVIENVENLNADDLISNILSLVSNENKYVNVFDMLHSMRQMDDNTYVHSMNVSLMCNILARWLRLGEEDIKTATLSGMLHDIGKLKIPEKIIKKPARLTEWELGVVRTHPREGYNILMTAPVSDHVKNAALMHHERCDGSGYPLKLSGPQIDPFAKIVAIADVYDAMTSTRVYRGPQCPFTVIAAFENEGFQKYEPAYILTFLKNIVNTYILHRVRLTNGEEGDVIYINPDRLSRPMVRVGDKYIDLSKEPHLRIDSLL